MEILLDTHILIWHLTNNSRLSKEKSAFIENATHKKYISIVSLWEIALKNSLGKLEVYIPLNKMIPKEVILLDITIPHLEVLQKLPFHHKDPFDRVIISQAISENLLLMSEDGNFPFYDEELI
ncbi:type II toxin-antitoxin system VapC family toxin [Bernardetia sp. OM2101]|uniref:type II toxin-antitoxin system VapC family toxin n=1 Tax=Bernardetia sp. OM2101 TaxID=3344876 RepID=UPI0035CFB7BF